MQRIERCCRHLEQKHQADQIDLAAMFDLLVAGRGIVVGCRPKPLAQRQAWAGYVTGASPR